MGVAFVVVIVMDDGVAGVVRLGGMAHSGGVGWGGAGMKSAGHEGRTVNRACDGDVVTR